MDVKILEQGDACLRFIVQGIDLEVANALRRIMISEVPSMAIEDVIMIENSSPMRDEMLAHRLGLIPLKTDLESYLLPEDCDCLSELGCSKCSVTLTLETDATDSPRVVYSKALKSNDPYIVPVNGKIPILKLASNQKVRLEAYARLGRGSEHAKWQPVSICALRPVYTITLDQERCNACKNCVPVCFKQIIRTNNGRMEVFDQEKCDGCKLCEESCLEGAIEIESSKDNFLFHIESTSIFPPERIFDNSIEILKKKTQEFVDHVSKIRFEEHNEEI